MKLSSILAMSIAALPLAAHAAVIHTQTQTFAMPGGVACRFSVGAHGTSVDCVRQRDRAYYSCADNGNDCFKPGRIAKRYNGDVTLADAIPVARGDVVTNDSIACTALSAGATCRLHKTSFTLTSTSERVSRPRRGG